MSTALNRLGVGQVQRIAPPVFLSDASRSMGMFISAGKGSGKSWLMARAIAFCDLQRGVPQVVFDPLGATNDNLLEKISRLPVEQQKQLWERVVFVDMSGRTDQVVTWPLYYRLGNESLYDISQRYLNVIRRLDPHLMSASIEGWNALWKAGTNVGIVLALLGWQVTEAERLMRKPHEYAQLLSRLHDEFPQAQHAIKAFTSTYMNLAVGNKQQGVRPDVHQLERLTGSFRTKIDIFNYDLSMRAMFGATVQTIDWQEVIAKGQTVLLDFRHELDSEKRRFKMLWVFHNFFEFIKHRGVGRHKPVGLIVDELMALYSFDNQAGHSIFASDLDELVNVWSRNCRVWLTLCTQELFQLDEKSRKVLMGMGSNIIGVTADSESAEILTKELIPYIPGLIKRYEPVLQQGFFGTTAIDFRPIDYSIAEQVQLGMQLFKRLKPFHFIAKIASGEGGIAGTIKPLSIANLDTGMWVRDDQVRRIRELLSSREGFSKQHILADIQGRQDKKSAPLIRGTLERDAKSDDHLPVEWEPIESQE